MISDSDRITIRKYSHIPTRPTSPTERLPQRLSPTSTTRSYCLISCHSENIIYPFAPKLRMRPCCSSTGPFTKIKCTMSSSSLHRISSGTTWGQTTPSPQKFGYQACIKMKKHLPLFLLLLTARATREYALRQPDSNAQKLCLALMGKILRF
jgi:hypothetical protein